MSQGAHTAVAVMHKCALTLAGFVLCLGQELGGCEGDVVSEISALLVTFITFYALWANHLEECLLLLVKLNHRKGQEGCSGSRMQKPASP